MKHLRKLYLMILLSVLLGLILSACTTEGDTEHTSSEAETEDQAVTKDEIAAANESNELLQAADLADSAHQTALSEAPARETVSLPELAIFQEGYPQFFMFRNSEGLSRMGRISYEAWRDLYAPFPGVMGKVVDEEVPGRETYTQTYFKQFKRDFPDKLVMLHFNGEALMPKTYGEPYFAGHWLYYNGTKAVSDIPATTEPTVITVEDADLFAINIGNFNDRPDELVIVRLGEDESPDWFHAEHARIISIDKDNSTITVERGIYQSEPLAFEGGNTKLAAHVTKGPQGGAAANADLMWVKNFAIDGPADADGKRAYEVYAEQIAGFLLDGGLLETFDGVQFDVLSNYAAASSDVPGRGADANFDNKIDYGYIDGVNVHALGVHQFLELLRAHLGDDKLIMADGTMPIQQRGFRVLNGMESEGWPDTLFSNFDAGTVQTRAQDWSSGLNRSFFWAANSAEPALNYNVHKTEYRAPYQDEAVHMHRHHRIITAVSLMTDFALATNPTGYYDERYPPDKIIVYDELVNGKAEEIGWLGQPNGPAVRLAKTSPDLLQGTAASQLKKEVIPPAANMTINNYRSDRRDFSVTGKTVFTLENIPNTGDMTLFFEATAEPLAQFPDYYARRIDIAVFNDKGKLLTRAMSWADADTFESSLYLKDLDAPKLTITITIEGVEGANISKVTLHDAPDAIVREFDHGVALVNPSSNPYTFDLETLFPGQSLRRIDGVVEPEVNNGQPVSGSLVLEGTDALVLVKE